MWRGWIVAFGLLAVFGRPAAGLRPVGVPQDARSQNGSGAAPASAPRALLDRYCVTCHNERLKTAGLRLDSVSVADISKDAEVWEKVVRRLRVGTMPPVGRPRPGKHEYDELASWLETELDRAAATAPNPGRTETYHRLNRTEYRNAIRELLALDTDVASLLPADDASYGFDNIGGVLKINPSLMERYLAAARKISRSAIGSVLSRPAHQEFRISEELVQDDHVDGLPFGTRGGTLIRYTFPQDGEYEFKVILICRIVGQCDPSAGFADRHQLEITIDAERVQLFTLEPHDVDAPVDLQARVPVRAGPREIGVTFLQLPSFVEVESRRERFVRPYYNAALSQRPQHLAIYQPYVEKVLLTGPLTPGGVGDTRSRRRIFVCRPATDGDETGCAKNILSTLARRAYRRPVADADVQELLAFYRDGRAEADFESGVELALRRLLVSPQFIFRTEADPPNVAPNSSYRISDLELASRLSFFLWSSLPDDELLDVASRGRLSDPWALEQQVRRMLTDHRSEALVTNFAGQWLRLRDVESVRPSVMLFPNFDETLRQAFRRETELLVDSVLRDDRSVLELLTANYTFVNERLARHYGIPNIKGSHFRRVALADDNPRRGLLGHGSILTVTSRPNRTSPVLRGAWILENIFGTPPPPPPANVPSLPERKLGSQARVLSMREQMAEHRANPACTSCHAMMEPLGLALENFDAVGVWRDVDGAYAAIDASGSLPDGSNFRNLAEFRLVLLARPETFVRTVTEKLLTYALGRGLEYYDEATVRGIVRQTAAGHFKLSSLIVGIVKSTPFVMRRTAVDVRSAH